MSLRSLFEKCFARIRRWVRRRAPQDCKRLEPEVKYSDGSWLERPVTADQRRIEDYLEGVLGEGRRVLHVGTGNSSFAERFCRKAAIDSITVMEDELLHARSLGLPNYRCFLLNKYSSELKQLQAPYDFIVDNNLSSFACCRRHFVEMVRHYAAMLTPGGRVVTDAEGMRFYQEFAFPVSEGELREMFPDLRVSRVGEVVLINHA